MMHASRTPRGRVMIHSLKSLLVRLSFASAVLAAWWLAGGRGWTGGFWTWERGYSRPVAVITAVLLFGLVVGNLVYVWFSHNHRRSYDAAIGEAVSVLVAIIAAVL